MPAGTPAAGVGSSESGFSRLGLPVRIDPIGEAVLRADKVGRGADDCPGAKAGLASAKHSSAMKRPQLPVRYLSLAIITGTE